MSRTNLAFDDRKDRRAAERVLVGLPASIALGNQSYTAKLLNLTRHGAMLEMALPLRVHATVVINCGSISAEAEIMWIKNAVIGVNFKHPIADFQIREQISRYSALQALRCQERRS